MANSFQKLFEPIQIGGLTVKNRTVMAPMTTLFGSADGEVTEQAIEYYGARARGGTGMIVVEGIFIDENALQIPNSMSVRDDKFVPGLASLADSIKRNGSTAVMQLIHAGIQAWLPQTVGPSAIGRISGKPISSELTPKELTTEEVEGIIQAFGMAAFRAMMAGWDMVEIHGTHGYLIHQFLSPLTNKRTDKYGQDRDLFPLEIIKSVRGKCGPALPIIYRLCADEALGDSRLTDGITLEDAKKTAARLAEAGVNAFDVTGGQDDCIDQYVPSAYVLGEKQGCFLHLASEIKKVVDVPVISGGGIESPELANRAIGDGSIDMVFLGRQLIADPFWATKAKEGRPEDIRPCVKCLHCGDRILFLKPVNCAVNPLAGFEYKDICEAEIKPTYKKKKLLVVGAGPGGLEAARIAAMRGHQVTVVEQSDSIGGALKIAAIPEFKRRYQKLVDWYGQQIKELAVELKTGTTADEALVEQIDPDVVVVATGAEPMDCDVAGISKTVFAEDVLTGKVQCGQNVLVLGLGLIGAEVALFLAQQGKKVKVIDALENPPLLMTLNGFALLKPGEGLFARNGIEVALGTNVCEIKDDQVVCEEPNGTSDMGADTVVNALGRKPSLPQAFLDQMKTQGKDVVILGDSLAPRQAKDAVHEGFMLGYRL